MIDPEAVQALRDARWDQTPSDTAKLLGFTSVDPIMGLGDVQQWSAYNYTGDSPISQSDPTGLDPCIGGGRGCDDDDADSGGRAGAAAFQGQHQRRRWHLGRWRREL